MENKEYMPIRICKHIHISHNFFVDDVLLFAMLTKISWICIKSILDRFQKASGLAINKSKSILFHNDSNEAFISWICQLFGVNSKPISNGIKYLGYRLKPKAFTRDDWRWLIDRFLNKISLWEYRSLSLGGRVVLAQSVLMQLSVYWAHLFLLPASIIHSMNRIIANFIWGAKADRNKFHLTKLGLLSMPKFLGGWGLMDIRTFGKALLCKSLWRGIFNSNPWSAIIRQKYLKGRSLEFWFRTGSLGIKQGSAIWLSFRRIEQFFLGNLKWNIFSGTKIFIGLDHLAGLKGNLLIPDPLLFHLHRSGFFTWDRIIDRWIDPYPILLTAADLGIPQALVSLWDTFISSIEQAGLKRSGFDDHLVWSLPLSNLQASGRVIYMELISMKNRPIRKIFPVLWWKLACPLKLILFAWLVFHNKNLSWENLRKRSWHGPNRCVFCKMEEETNFHMFFNCRISLHVWYDIASFFSFQRPNFSSVDAAFTWWGGQNANIRPILPTTIWCLWKWRNLKVFEDSNISSNYVLSSVLALYPSHT